MRDPKTKVTSLKLTPAEETACNMLVFQGKFISRGDVFRRALLEMLERFPQLWDIRKQIIAERRIRPARRGKFRRPPMEALP